MRGAVEKRRREFAAGRACAREALARLGIRDFALLPAGDRAPIWPDGIVGSITHCEGYCAAAVSRRAAVASVGLDAEVDAPLEERLHAAVLTPSEVAHLGGLPRVAGLDWPKLVFSAKESVYKCVYPSSGARLGFHDVEVAIDATAGSFEARVEGRFSVGGRFVRTPGLVLTGAVIGPETV